MSAITVVAFDYGGVIAQRIDENTVLHMAAEAGAAPGPFLRELWSHRAAYDAGTLDAPAYWSAVTRDAGGKELTEELLQSLLILDALGWTRVNPGMVRWMGALRRAGLRLVLISNMAVATYDMVVQPSSWIHLFDHVVLSGREGVNKPDSRIFSAAVEKMGVASSELLFIDDITANVEGARAAGLHSCTFVDPPSLALALQRDFPGVPTTGLLAT
ncbi:MAG: HAD family phosphatase [Spirochaetaceae bacterium]|nr:MAG: HAD family phosphatase [Spirochaetaceae bacterium]